MNLPNDPALTAPTDRDRDASGRALNARPRDALGRPLPYGADGVERAPEGQHRTAAETLQDADALLRAGRPFHAHEVFEDAWKTADGVERELWRGLAQLAVGLTHLARGYPDRAARLLERGHQSLSRYRDLNANNANPATGESTPPIDVAAVLSWAEEAVRACQDSPGASALPLPPMPLLPAQPDEVSS